MYQVVQPGLDATTFKMSAMPWKSDLIVGNTVGSSSWLLVIGHSLVTNLADSPIALSWDYSSSSSSSALAMSRCDLKLLKAAWH